MQIIDATPTADFPKQVIMMDRELAKRHPAKGFYLRIGEENGNVKTVDLDGQATLPGAVSAARAMGFKPTHWMEVTAGFASRLPTSLQAAST